MNRTFLIAISFLMFPAALRGQLLQFQTYAAKDGLLSGNVKILHQDKRGFIWVGSSEGMTVFDGVEFTSFSGRGSSLSYTEIHEIGEDGNGTIWFATLEGLWKFTEGYFEHAWPDSASGLVYVQALAVDPSGGVWFAGNQGVFRMRGGEAERLQRFPENIENPHLVCTADSMVWIVVAGEVSIYSLRNETFTAAPFNVPSSAPIVSMITDDEKTVWILTADGSLFRYHDANLLGVRRFGIVEAGFLLDDRAGNIWIGAWDGLRRVPKKEFERGRPVHFDTRNGLPQNLVLCGLTDREGNIWFGTNKHGLLKLTSQDLRTFRLPFRFRMHDNKGATVDSAGHIWIASHEDGLLEFLRDRHGEWHQFVHAFGDSGGERVSAVVCDREGRLWIDLFDGDVRRYAVRHRSPEKSELKLLSRLVAGRDIPEGTRHALVIDRNNNLWFSVLETGVVEFDLRRFQSRLVLTGRDGSHFLSIRAMLVDRENNIWMGDFWRGLTVAETRPDGTRLLRRFTTEDGLPDNRIRSLFQSRDGRIWIGTRYGGIAVYDESGMRTIGIDDGIQSNAIWCFAEDTMNRIWFGSHIGLEAINSTTLRPERFNPELAEIGIANCGIMSDGILWGVSSERLMLYNDGNDQPVAPPPPVYLREMFVNEVPTGIVGEHQLAYDENHLRLEFIGLSFKDEKAVRYRYRLIGLDEGWRLPTTQREVTYSSVSPGSYRFEVKAINRDGIESVDAAGISFSIATPFWRQWWFISLSACAVVAMITMGVGVRIRNLQKEQRLQQEFSQRLMQSQEADRSRIAAELHDSLVQNILIMKNRALVGMEKREDTAAALTQFNEISDIASHAIGEVKEIAFNLRPYHLDRLGLTKALRSLTTKMSDASSTAFIPEIDEVDSFFSKDGSTMVYRIIQEGINNVVKHAEATECVVRVKKEPRGIVITLQDNGKGFSLEREDGSGRGFGLSGMAERAKMLHGLLSVDSAPGRGTTVRVEVPGNPA